MSWAWLALGNPILYGLNLWWISRPFWGQVRRVSQFLPKLRLSVGRA